ncbi:MAG TPA: S8 family serine peptidase, partial [Alphaproteobacteria bacterium]|nr:S8 family serine peptidase [Alphaproteobacteria bacterium]
MAYQSETDDLGSVGDERENRLPHNFSTDIGFINAAMRSFPPHNYSSPDISALLSATSTYAKGLPSDPGLTSGSTWEQWIYTGQYGINIGNLWQDFTGEGIRVAVIDDGFNYNHSELAANFRTDLDYDVLDNDFDSLNDQDNIHGTLVSQVIVADDNGIGNVGVAFDADLVGVRRGFGSEGTIQDTLDAFAYFSTVQAERYDSYIDIINNSWSVTTAFGDNKKIDFFGTDTSAVINMINSLATGADNSFTVFSSGNGREEGMSANYKNFQNSPYVITVGSINEGGTYSYFSEAGANVLITAPGEDIRLSNAFDNGSGTLVSGTSFSAPLVSGVLALMLEANNSLTYNEAQEILAITARQIDVSGTGWADKGWQYNGATNINGGGMHFSHDYGFGLVDAHAAVRVAESLSIVGYRTPQYKTTPFITNTSSIIIPDQGSITSSIHVEGNPYRVEIEHVLIDLDITHEKAGDLTVTLVSPFGTENVLAYNIENGAFTTAFGIYNGINFEFSSVANWGEAAEGDWTLKIEDNAVGNTGTLNSWSISFIGKNSHHYGTYYFTDDFLLSPIENQNVNGIDSPLDIINASAVTFDTTIDLNSGGIIDGATFTIDEATVIERVITGDGNDMITGNAVDNKLYGMRGDDMFYGSMGSDIIDGGDGNDEVFYTDSISDFVVTLIDSVTVSLSNTLQSFTDTLLNMEFFNFDGVQYSRAALDEYVADLNAAPPVVSKLYLGWDGGQSSVINDATGTFNYTSTDLGKDNLNIPLVVVERGLTTLNALSYYLNGSQINSAVVRDTDLTEIILTGFQTTKIIQDQSTQDINVMVQVAMTGKIYTGSGNDVITVEMSDFGVTDKWSGWFLQSGAGDDVVFLNGYPTMSYTKIYLGDGNDAVLSNSSSKDFIYAGDGNDFINASDGDDRIYGENGNDEISGGNGNDYIDGGTDDDIITGGEGSDRLVGGSGNDYLDGGNGNDVIYGQDGDDEVHGGAGNDVLRGQEGNDIIYGDDGADKIYGETGDDELHGGNGNDILRAQAGNDIVYGDDGDDKVYGEAGEDEIHGGLGNDYILGGFDNDLIYGDADNDKLYGNGGDDTIDGGSGIDFLSGGNGNDTLFGGDDNDKLYGEADDDRLDGGAG